MTESLDPKELVSIDKQEITFCKIEGLIEVLTRKGIMSKEGFFWEK